MIDDKGCLVFTDEQFDGKWREWISLFSADQIACKMIAPLPYLDAPVFPMRLNNELVLDRLTNDEVTRCYLVGVIRPTSLRFPLIYKEIGVGIRKTTFSPKLILKCDEPDLPVAEEEGVFGYRPLLRDDLVIEDVGRSR